MNNKNINKNEENQGEINKNQENQGEINENNTQNQFSQSGIYLRDDHCDWGSSGMKDLADKLDDNN